MLRNIKIKQTKTNKQSIGSSNVAINDVDRSTTKSKSISNNSSMSNDSKLNNIVKYKITDNEGAVKTFEGYDELSADVDKITELSEQFDSITDMSSDDLSKFIEDTSASVVKCLEHIIDNPNIDFEITDDSNIPLNTGE